MSDGETPGPPPADRRWPRRVYGQGTEPDVRFSFANERTFLAWIRTGLGLLTAGVAIVALAAVAPNLSVEAHIASIVLILAGVVCGANAFWRWARAEKALRTGRPLPSSIMMPILVGVLAVIGILALFVVLPLP